MMIPSAISPTFAACSGVEIPKPTAIGTAACCLGRCDQVGQLARKLLPLAGDAHRRDQVDEALGARADLGAAPGGVVGATSGISASPC